MLTTLFAAAGTAPAPDMSGIAGWDCGTYCVRG